MATYRTSIPGVPGGPIETSFPVYLKIAPEWRTNVRPGIKARVPRLPVQHETANPNSMAVDDATYLFNGAEGRSASWHMTVDDTAAYIGIPLDEITWQASDGAGPGNYNGISCELAVHRAIVSNDARRAKSQQNAAELMGKIGARLNATPPAKRHHDYAPDGKWCPREMMNRGEWNRYVDWWNGYYTMEKRVMAGGGTTSTYKPGDRIEVTVQALNVRTGYGLHHRIVTTLTAGRTATVIMDNAGVSSQYNDGYTWLNVNIDGFGTGWMATGTAAESWITKARTPAPVTPPKQYAPVMPVKELLATNFSFKDKYNTAEGITTVNESEFIFVADVIEFKRTSPAKQYAMEAAKEVKPPYQEGERVIAAWLVKSTEGTWWYLLTGGDDEWVRVKYVDTVRISDAPLLGNDAE